MAVFKPTQRPPENLTADFYKTTQVSSRTAAGPPVSKLLG